MIGGGAQVGRDVPPFMVVIGRSQVCGVNVVGMRRANMSPAERQGARRAYHLLYRTGYGPARALERLRPSADRPRSPKSSRSSKVRRAVCARLARRRA